MDKLIKSFVAIKSGNGLEKGEIILLKRSQAIVPLNQDELCFESDKSRMTFTFKALKHEMPDMVKVHEYFKSIEEKFDHIS